MDISSSLATWDRAMAPATATELVRQNGGCSGIFSQKIGYDRATRNAVAPPSTAHGTGRRRRVTIRLLLCLRIRLLSVFYDYGYFCSFGVGCHY